MARTTSQGPVVVGYQDHDSDDALEWACQEAARRGTSVRVLHAYPRELRYPWGYGYPLPVGDLHRAEERLRTDASSLLEGATERVRSRYPGLPLTATLAATSPDAGLVLASEDATLLVVGRHERPSRVATHGSVSLSVAAHASCPVVVVPSPVPAVDDAAAGDAGGSGDIEVVAHAGTPATLATLFAGQVVVGVDDSPEAADAVGFAFSQAPARGVGLVALHAWWVDPVLLAPSMPVDWNEMGAADQGAIDGILAPWKARFPDVKVARILARLGTAEALVAASSDAELLVVGSRGRGGFARLLLGSVSRKVLHHARCPVAVVRRGQLEALHDLALS
jgi:nucleotide-binding universal stress UspA family protein